MNHFYKQLILFFLLPMMIWGQDLSFPGTDVNSEPQEQLVTASLLSDHTKIAAGQRFFLAVKMQIQEKWHIAWRFAGASGMPTTFDVKLPEGFSHQEVLWPTPKLIVVPPPEGMPISPFSYGHYNETVFLIPVKAPDSLAAGKKLTFTVVGEWTVCEDQQCKFGGEELSLEISK